MANWKQPICLSCWDAWCEAKDEPGRDPYRLKEPDEERCAYCGTSTCSGVYVREHPSNVTFPAAEDG